MRIENIQNGFGHRLVTVVGITADRPVSDDFIKGFACAHAGESPQRLFGMGISRFEDGTGAVVRLDTD
jgi:hypothetical protein